MGKKPAKPEKPSAPNKRESASRAAGKIAAADGRVAVETWLDHVRPELQPLVRRLDRLILEAMPDAVSAVKWRRPGNPLGVPFYGLPGRGWIASVNAFKAHVKLMLFAGSAIKPTLPERRTHNAIDFRSVEELNEKQIKDWLAEARKLPGWGRL